MVKAMVGPQGAAYRARAIFVAAMLCYWAAMSVYAPILPVYARGMGATLSMVGLTVGAYGFVQMVTRIPVGVWSDGAGQRRIFVVTGMVICAVAAAGLALAPNPWWLVFFQGLEGLAAASWVCSTVLFVSYFPQSHPAVPLSIMSFVSAVGQMLATSLGGLLAQHLGWTAPFWAAVAFSIVGAGLLTLVPEDATASSSAVTPESLLRTLRAPLLLLACGVGATLYFATYSTVYSFTPVLAQGLGATRAQLGYLTTAAFATYAVITLGAARLIGSLGEKWALLLGLTILVVAILPTPLVTGVGGLAVLQGLIGLSRGLLYPLLMSLAIRAVLPQDRAAAMGVFQASYAFGMFAGPWLSGKIAGSVGLSAIYLLSGAVCLACLVSCGLITPHVMSRRA